MLPIVSLLPEDLSKSFGIQAGRYRIVSSEWLIHQFPPSKDTTKEQSAPFLCWARGFQPVDLADKPIGEVEVDYSLQVPNRDKDGKALPLDKSKFAPAAVPGQPLPLRVGSKGPFLVGDAKINEKSKVGLFLKSMYSLGFDAKRFVDTGMNLGVLVGTVAEVYEYVSKNEGKDAITGEAFKDSKFPAFSKIHRWGYEGGSGSASGIVVPNGVAASPASAAAVAAAAPDAGDAHAAAVILLKKIIELHGKNPMPLEEVGKKILGAWQKVEPKIKAETRNAAKALLISPEFYSSTGMEEIAIYDGTNVEFA